jgi:hypothetical protein
MRDDQNIRVAVFQVWYRLALAALWPRNVALQQMLQGLLRADAKVEVSALDLPNSGHPQAY